MGSTPRQHRLQVPLPTRSTDVTVLEQCPGRWALTLFNEDRQAEATFFALGTALHETIEEAILLDLDQGEALDTVEHKLDLWVESLTAREPGSVLRVIQSSKRNLDTVYADAPRMVENWFNFVHPNGQRRHPIYDGYEWPPKVEKKFVNKGAGLHGIWGSIDAVFTPKPPTLRAMIVDWKSGTQKQKSSFQLDFYRYGDRRQGAKAVFHHLDRVRHSAMIQEADEYPGHVAMEDRIRAADELKLDLLDGIMPAFNPDWYCSYCPVQEFCPADGPIENREENGQQLSQLIQWARPLTEIGE